MYDPIWSRVPPWSHVAALLETAKDDDTLMKTKIVYDVALGLGLDAVVLDPDDRTTSIKVLLEALAELGVDE